MVIVWVVTFQLTSSILELKARELRLLTRAKECMESLMLINNKTPLSLGATVLALKTPKIILIYTK